jgi:hypothetical protein
MWLALIPPLAALETTKRTNYQLMLPHLASNHEYSEHYRALCNNASQFVMLDNGIAESNAWPWDHLCEMAWNFGVDEIVLPDVIGDLDKTIQASAAFINDFRRETPLGCGLMFVAQGQNFAECCRAITWAAARPQVTTIGIPRHLLQTTGDHMIRFRLVKYIERVNQEYLFRRPMPIQIHFLGASPLWVREIEVAGHFLRGKIRGMDTSMPFVYGMCNEIISDTVQTIGRSENFFEWKSPQDVRYREKMDYNVDTFIRWANGDA